LTDDWTVYFFRPAYKITDYCLENDISGLMDSCLGYG